MKRILILSILSLLLICSCEQHKYKTVSKKTIKIKREKVKDEKSDKYIFWYFIGDFDVSPSNSYYYSSSTPVSDFKSVNWTLGKPTGFDKEKIEEEEVEQVEVSDLESSIQTNIEDETEMTETTEEDNSSDGDSSGDDGGGDD